MSDQYIGEIRIFPGNAIPAGWEICDGKILTVSENLILFTLIGAFYGGNGESTFGLPDLRGAATLGVNTGNDGPYIDTGMKGGQVTVTLNQGQMAPHTHAVNAGEAGISGMPSGAVWSVADGRPAPNVYATSNMNPLSMNLQAIGSTGGNQPHNNLMPYTAFVFCIAMKGEVPERG
jgi:microcystin-dependent protein